NLTGLVDTLTLEVLPQWEGLAGAMEINDAENFAEKLGELARKHNCIFLQEYAAELLESVDVV
ncbi:MAG: hypothetical protein D3910_20505, partial [Candidatus Electrothrix sp. ATG2]|nr:hypothetical protein [Candidatus Electrothrix sp. ATG2]